MAGGSDADAGGQSERSVDLNKLVLCSAFCPAQQQFESGGEDWPEAYRHSPISRAESLGCVVAWWHQAMQAPVFQVFSSLLFGTAVGSDQFQQVQQTCRVTG